ncbi:MAG: class I SAM-dependent methyltransferase [Chloroflexi bacterium]|nr:class I SAM-dependent methyltransferase [Chloroflexota bacterium]MYK35785.1 class I SAM-dependent methyltransferase [Chloroflexota bacterium]
MSLLDCGCGPGSITLGLAEVLAPGEVVGIDRDASRIEIAEQSTSERGVANVRFQTADVHELPFADASFDAVFAHAVLQHVREPLRALAEMRRVLKPGGVVGLRDDDRGSVVIAPQVPEVLRLIELLTMVEELNGGDPRVGKRYRELLRTSGFEEVAISASCEYDADIAATRRRASLAVRAAREFVGPAAVEQRWSTPEEMERLASECASWGEHPDAFSAVIWCEAVGRKA